MKNLVVYSGVFGNIDDPRVLLGSELQDDPRVSFVFYSDRPPAAVPPWRVEPSPWYHADPRMQARFVKLHPHILFPQADAWLWADGALRFLPGVSLFERVEKWLRKHPMATLKSPLWQCLYQDVDYLAYVGKESAELLRRQGAAYRAAGYPPYNGAVDTCLLARRNTPQIVDFNRGWWDELCHWTTRDQPAFLYSAWKQRCSYQPIDHADCAKTFYYQHHQT